MDRSEPSTLAEIDPKLLALKTIEISERHKNLKGSLVVSSSFLFKLECHSWKDFIQLLEPVFRYPIDRKSPTMPITIDSTFNEEKEMVTFNALSGLTYPTLLIYSCTGLDDINKKKMFLKECGYVVIVGKLSFYKGE